MINLLVNMQTLEIREDIYERFLISKLKHKPHLSNEDFIQFLMNQFENCCSKVLCNGYRNGITENSNMESQVSENTTNDGEIDSNVKENVSLQDFQLKSMLNSPLTTCPECKFSSLNRHDLEQHFDECHDMSGAFPCTCGQCFGNLSQFLAHYIVCPIAATDLQNSSFNEELFDEEDDEDMEEEEEVDDLEEISVPGDDKDIIDSSQHTDNSNEQPLDFHVHRSSLINAVNLVKLQQSKESQMTDYSINALSNFDNNHNSSSNGICHLPETVAVNNASSITTSSPGNTEQLKKPGKVYECEHCEKNFKSKGLLDQHKHLHFPPRHECEFCGRRFRWPPQFYTHKQQCSKRKLGNVNANGNNHKKLNYNFSSPPAPGVFSHSESRIQQATGKIFPHSQVTDQCLCGYKSGTLTDLYEHKRSCVASARAMILQKIIDYKSIQSPPPPLMPTMPSVNGNNNLSSPSVHSVMQNFLSNSTNTATIPTSYQSHIQSGIDSMSQNLPPINNSLGPVPKIQNDEKPFECDFCESRFMTKISLKQHLDGKHSDQAKYCCEKCGKGYFWNASYNYHKKKCTVKPLLNAAATGLSR